VGREWLGLIAEFGWIEPEERQRVGQLGYGHVDQLACVERPNPHRQLRLVGVWS